jgi:hypothetical protein
LGLLALAFACSPLSPPIPDGGAPDAGSPPCTLPTLEAPDGGLGFVLSVCAPPDASVFVAPGFLTLVTPDGGDGSAALGCRDTCGLCSRALCGDPGGIAETKPGERRSYAYLWDGLMPGAALSCADDAGMFTCHDFQPAVTGPWDARFCFSLSVTRDGSGRPIALGPTDCVDVPFNVPFDTASVGAIIPP